MKQKSGYFIAFAVLLVLILIPIAYYYHRLTQYIHQPLQIVELVLTASNIRSFSIKAASTSIIIFLAAAALDLAVLGFDKSAFKRLFFIRGQSARGDLWCWALSIVRLYDFFALLFSFGFFYVISSIIVKSGGFGMIQFIPIPFIQFILIFLIGDLKHYLWHRFMHHMPFWELHKYHHSATEFNLITTSRGHFIEKGFLIVFDSILFSLLGAPVEYFISFVVIKEFYDHLLHSDINWSLGWVGKYLLVSPKAHKIHHSNHPLFYDKNFGTMLIFWDKLFGTYVNTDSEITIGLESNPYNKNGFWTDMFEGTTSFAKATKDAIKKRVAYFKL